MPDPFAPPDPTSHTGPLAEPENRGVPSPPDTAGAPVYPPASGYPGGPGGPAYPTYAAYPATHAGMSTSKKLIIAGVIVGIVLVILTLTGVLVSFVARGNPGGGPTVAQFNAAAAAPDQSGIPEGLSAASTGQHFHNHALGIDMDVPADWERKTDPEAVVYLSGKKGCSLILMDKRIPVPPELLNDSLKSSLKQDSPTIVFGTPPVWLGQQQPSSVLGSKSTEGDVPVIQNYFHFYRGGHMISVIETRRAADVACQPKFQAVEQSFHVR